MRIKEIFSLFICGMLMVACVAKEPAIVTNTVYLEPELPKLEKLERPKLENVEFVKLQNTQGITMFYCSERDMIIVSENQDKLKKTVLAYEAMIDEYELFRKEKTKK